MKRNYSPKLIICLFLFLTNIIHAQFQWAGKIGGGIYDKGKKIVNGTNGDVYIIGEYAGNPDFDPGPGTFNCPPPTGAYILKLDSGGNFLWAKSFGAYSTDGISRDANGNILICGLFYGTVDFDPGPNIFNLINVNGGSLPNLYAMKLDSSGDFMWAVRYGNSSTDAKDIANDANGNVFITGFYRGVIDFDPGTGITNLGTANTVSGYVLKLDATGNFAWVKEMRTLSLGTSATGVALETDASGNIITTGFFNGNVDFDPGATVDTMRAGGLLYDIFIQKLDASGNYIWTKVIGNASTMDMPSGIRIDASNNIYTVGSFGGTVDFNPGAGVDTLTAIGTTDAYVWKLDASGNYMWAKNMADNIWAMTLDVSGNVYTLGFSAAACDLDPGAGTYNLAAVSGFIQKLNSNGNFQWARGYYLATSLNDLCVNGDDVYFTGRFTGTIDFDPDSAVYNLNGGINYAIIISKLRSYPSTTIIENSNSSIDLKVFPNPSTGLIYIQLTKPYTGSIEVTDNLGRLIHYQELNNVSEVKMDLSAQQKGIYYVRMNQNILKVLIEN